VPLALLGGDRQADAEGERAPASRLTRERDRASHHRDELGGNGETEPGAPVVAGGRAVRLIERVEDEELFALGHADARVAHGEANDRARFVARDEVCPDEDLSLVREFHGVAHEVDHDLLQALRIADQRGGHVGRDAQDEPDALRVRAVREAPQRRAQAAAGLELDRLELQLACLDLGEIEDVVDDAEELVSGRLRGLDVVALLGGERGVAQEIGHSDDAVDRGPDLVAHPRQEVRFGAGGGLREIALGAQLRGAQLEGNLLRSLEHPRRREVRSGPLVTSGDHRLDGVPRLGELQEEPCDLARAHDAAR